VDLPVVYVDLETPEQYFRDLATLGQLLGNEARAQEIQDFYQTRLDRLDDELKGLGDEQKPRVLLVQYSEQGGEVALNVPSASWLQTTEAELAGGVPVWKEAAQGGGWTVVNFEQIAAWDPDQIFVISYGTDPAEVVAGLEANAQWQALRAVQEGQLYAFPGDVYSWDQPDPRWVLGTSWLASKMHPERLEGLDLMDEVQAFFGQMYGMEESAVEEQVLPLLRGDVE
jgi:iron complex transport system substrate-binding protein